MCGGEVVVEPSLPLGDAPCPRCGSLLWFVRLDEQPTFYMAEEATNLRERVFQRLAQHLGVPRESLGNDLSQLKSLGMDSLDWVELVMELEEDLDEP